MATKLHLNNKLIVNIIHIKDGGKQSGEIVSNIGFYWGELSPKNLIAVSVPNKGGRYEIVDALKEFKKNPDSFKKLPLYEMWLAWQKQAA